MVPTLPSLEKICGALGITMSQLFAGDGDAVALTGPQQRLLERWSMLDEGQQAAIYHVIDEMASRKQV